MQQNQERGRVFLCVCRLLLFCLGAAYEIGVLARAQHRAVRAVADPLLELPGERDHPVEVNAGLDTHLSEHVEHILGGDVAGGAGAKGQPPSPAREAS